MTLPAARPPRPPARLARRGVARTLCLALAPAHAGAWPQVRLPSLGESASTDLSVGTERRLGEQIMREIRRDPTTWTTRCCWSTCSRSGSRWWRRRASAATSTPTSNTAFAWEAFLVRDRSVNAFALPGGYVGMHLGLIAITATPTSWLRCWRTN